MGSGWAIRLGPSWVNLIINLDKYINIIDFIYIIDIRKKNYLIDYLWIKIWFSIIL